LTFTAQVQGALAGQASLTHASTFLSATRPWYRNLHHGACSTLHTKHQPNPAPFPMRRLLPRSRLPSTSASQSYKYVSHDGDTEEVVDTREARASLVNDPQSVSATLPRPERFG